MLLENDKYVDGDTILCFQVKIRYSNEIPHLVIQKSPLYLSSLQTQIEMSNPNWQDSQFKE